MIPLKLKDIYDGVVDGKVKGIPPISGAIRLRDIGDQGWSLLNDDLPFPVAILKESSLNNNSRWMRRFLDLTGADICPHGKTTVAPQLFDIQIRDGAWGITAATVNHIRVYREFGVQRILLANQLIGKQGISYICDELARDPDFDFYCLVDSEDNIRTLACHVKAAQLDRPLNLLLEVGIIGGRTGIRSLEEALNIAELISQFEPYVSLVGIEAFEGLYATLSIAEQQRRVADVSENFRTVAQACDDKGYFHNDEIILTMGGSAHFDSVVNMMNNLSLSKLTRVVLRSGCYLTHDSSHYKHAIEAMKKRSVITSSIEGDMQAALEVWAEIQSIPEPGLALANFGKRDVGCDLDMPIPLWHFCKEKHVKPQKISENVTVTGLNDQHAYLQFPKTDEFRVGDLLGFGVSHPCTTFDKWQLLLLIDDDYYVRSGIKTFF